MYRLKLFYFFFFLFFTATSQEVKVEFQAYAKKITGNIEDKNSREIISNVQNRVNEIFPQIKFVLIAEKRQYYLSYELPMNSDFHLQNFSKVATTMALDGEAVFVDKKSKMGFYLPISTNIVRKVNTDNIEWEVTKDSKEILGYKCYKAVGKLQNINEEYELAVPSTAWFAPSLSFQGGPTAYATLPGIILELETPKISFKAVKVRQGNYSIPKLDLNKKKQMTHQNFAKYYEEWSKKNMPRKN